MALSSKEKAATKKQSVEGRNSNAHGVVITVYVESVTTRSEDPTKKTKPRPHFSGPRGTQGYDRRALLLAHSRQLRNAGSQKVPIPLRTTNRSRPKIKSKGIWLNQPVRICLCSSSRAMLPSSTIRRRNERGACKESSDGNQSKKRRSSGKNSPPFLGQMKNILKQLSCKEI